MALMAGTGCPEKRLGQQESPLHRDEGSPSGSPFKMVVHSSSDHKSMNSTALSISSHTASPVDIDSSHARGKNRTFIEPLRNSLREALKPDPESVDVTCEFRNFNECLSALPDLEKKWLQERRFEGFGFGGFGFWVFRV